VLSVDLEPVVVGIDKLEALAPVVNARGAAILCWLIRYEPMPLVRRREPFDDRAWLFELKWDGWRSLAYVNGSGASLVSRNGNPFRSFADLASELSFELNADDAVLDGEIVKLDGDGRPNFLDLMRRHGPFAFVAFDVLVVNGKDIRRLALVDRKKVLRAIVPKGSTSVLYAEAINGHGRELFDIVCKQDLEGIVAKHRRSQYGTDEPRQWVKVKNPDYSQARDRHELFERS
jgi:bifunctional non-homologous end joining protein LigD